MQPRSPRALPAAVALAIAGASRVAAAGSMDPSPERLQLAPTEDDIRKAIGLGPDTPLPAAITRDNACQVIAASPGVFNTGSDFKGPNPDLQGGGIPSGNAFWCRPDAKSFANLAAEFGYAIAPPVLRGAHTYGQRAFELRFQTSIATINSDQSYWKLGTEGPRDEAKNQASVQNKDPSPVLAVYGVEARKGLPFGFETGAFFGWIGQTSLFVPGVSVRWVPKEGFRDDVLGLLPDVAFGAAFRTITGSSKLNVYTTALDVEFSKRITIASALEFTPYLALQRLIIAGRSGSLDLTPNVDANQQCGFTGYDSAEKDPTKRDRSKDCANTISGSNGKVYSLNGDFSNTVTYDTTVTHRTRTVGGIQLKRDHFVAAGEIAFDLFEPGSENGQLVGSRQATFALSAGASF
jgi:hypothetical protein